MTELAATPSTRNAAAKREAILSAARNLFLRDSYENVGIRDIARAAGVDAALVHRYAGSKDELFAEVLACSGDASEMLAGPRETFGERIADMLIDNPHGAQKLEGIIIMIRSSSSPKAIEVIRQSVDERFVTPISQWLGGEDADIRARLIGALIVGENIMRSVTEGGCLNGDCESRLRDRLAAILQGLVEA